MLDFTYYAPTKVFFGRDTYKKIGEIIKGYGFSKIMLQYGKGSIKKTGLYDAVMASLSESGIEVVEMGGVSPNPTLAFVHEAIRVARAEKVEMILAVGGGSVLDSSKSTATGTLYDGDVWDFHTKKTAPRAALPVGCILTLAAAGSEMSASSVLTNEEICEKRGCTSEYNRPLFAICDPTLTFTVDKYQTACGIVDSMAHTMERYFTPVPATELTDRVAEGILKSIISAGRVLMENPEDYDARATAMWGSSLSHNDLTGCGRQHALCVHQLEHALSGAHTEIAHGAGLAVLFPAWARYIYKENIPRFAQFARRVWDVENTDDEAAAREGIEKLAAFFASLDMPTTLSDFGIEKAELPALSDLCTYGKTRTIPSYHALDAVDIAKIFEICL